MAFNLGNITKTINSGLSNISAVSSAVSQISRIGSQLGSISNISSTSVNSLLTGGGFGGALGTGTGGVLSRLNGISGLLGGASSVASELQGLANSPIRIIPRSAAELFTATGGRFDALRQQIESLKNLSAFDQFVDNSYNPPWANDTTERTNVIRNSGAAASRIPNPLRNYNGNNYIITLGILSAREYNDPTNLRTNGFLKYIIKSGGGDYAKRYRNAGEGLENAEYFIEDLEFDAVIAPNPNTNVSLGTSLSFTVHEPYSMGNFIEAIIGASATSGFRNYLDAPFCLRIDFVGWNEDGQTPANFIRQPIFMPLKFTKIDFNVSGKGSVYAVQAVPMSETGLGDDINTSSTDINANGALVHEVLETNERSVTGVMNRRIESLEQVGALSPFDRYVIAFPKNSNALLDYVKTGAIDESKLTVTAAQIIAENKGLGIDPRLAAAAANREAEQRRIVITPKARLYAKLKTFAETPELMNELGLSVLIENTQDSTNEAHASTSAARVPNPDGTPSDRIDRASATMAPAERSADYQFLQGETITNIIEKIMLQSKFCRDNSTEEARNGMKRWFRIDTQVFISEDVSGNQTMGRAPKVYVYSVIPYETDEARHLAPNQTPANTRGLMSSAAKEYNYIYTGKNEDVLSFDISFNNAFTQNAFSNLGQNTGGAAGGASSSTTSAGTNANTTGARTGGLLQADAAPTNEPTGAIAERNRMAQSAASRSGDIKTSIAETFHHNLVNSTIDLCTAEMEILGDPFFIPQQTGNYSGRRGSHPTASDDGTMRYTESEVFVVVNFKTPFDYQVTGATMEYPQNVPQFSGLFSVWAVTNNFSGGKFTQRLKLIRRRGQTNAPTPTRTGVVQADSTSALNRSLPSGRTTGNPNAPRFTPTAVAGVDNPFGDIGASISNAATIFQNNPFGDVASQISSFGANALNINLDSLQGAASAFNGINSAVGGIFNAASNQSDALAASIPGAVGNLVGQATALQGQLPALLSIGGNLGNAMGALGGITERIPGGIQGAISQISSAAAALGNIANAGVFPRVPAAAPDMTAALRTSAPTVAAALANLAPANLPSSAPVSTGYGNDPLGEFGTGRSTPVSTGYGNDPLGEFGTGSSTPLVGTVGARAAADGSIVRTARSASQISQITGNDRAAAVINTVVRRGPR